MEKLVLLLFLVHQSSGIIYKLNVTEYNKMPELYKMDDYDSCLSEPGGTYCVIDADLSSSDNSDLMRMIQEYSEYKIKHFNHTQIHRALCVQRTCQAFIQNRSLADTKERNSVIQDCVNSSMWNNYKLEATLSNVLYCRTPGDKIPFDAADYVMALIVLILIILNGLGTSYDFIRGEGPGNSYLMAFSIRRNWKKLIAPAGVGPEPRLGRLKLFNGFRTITMVCVIFSHTALVMSYSYLNNPHFIESTYEDPSKQILYNGTLVTYTFFVMSGFLLAFNFELHAEKHKITLWEWPKGMVMRWLRLTPAYALLMFFIMTLMRHLGDGPLWQHVVTPEADACYQYWWSHLLYINNYLYQDTDCLPQTWYLAADTQLFGLGLLICIIARRPRTQLITLSFMLLVSFVIAGSYTYFQDLSAVVHQSPETYRTLYKYDETFRIVFVAGHTNMSTYALGIAFGLLAFHWMKDEQAMSQRLQKYKWIVWVTFPAGVGVILTGGLFYMDGWEPSMLVKVVYSMIHKPIFQLCVCVIMMSCIFRVENVYRGIVEWRGFTWSGRVSYSAFLLHSTFQRGLVGFQRQPSQMSEFYILIILAATVMLSFCLGALMWLTIESPLASVTKVLLSPPRRKPREKEPEQDDVTTKV
ncbi:nose resistant to fluoxetine protein 6-like [Choristoneura fumiferana]|uniref:nose resistant to fluoxetine protein 6-like n=1 Tax=Choristoneura fumiferana TaxID=7141 RepID=UPI003D15B046